MHEVRFYRNPDDGTYRAICTCGWLINGASLESLQCAAATHDLEADEVG